MSSHVVSRLTGILLVAAAVGCSNDDRGLLGPNLDVATSSWPPAEYLMLDDAYAALADEVPGFGGFFFDSSGTLTVNLKDPSSLESVRGQISEFFARRASGNVAVANGRATQVAVMRAQASDFDFRELHTWYADVVTEVGAVQGVTKTDIDDARNRIVIGAVDGDAIGRVRAAVARLAIPPQAVLVELFEPVRIDVSQDDCSPFIPNCPPPPSFNTLRQTIRPVLGGLGIGGTGGTCTLGYNVYHVFPWGAVDPERYWLTNAHCTSVFGQSTGHSKSQNAAGPSIGTEIVDPPLFTNSTDSRCPAGRQCRYSDAALFKYNSATWDFGRVAWPSDGNIWWTVTKRIHGAGDPIVGMVVHKVGRTTGHTQGTVEAVCADFPQANPNGSDTGRTMLCQGDATYVSGGGDSGSPVVEIFLAFGDVIDRGIHWGTGGIFSNANEWNREIRENIAGGGGITSSICFIESC